MKRNKYQTFIEVDKGIFLYFNSFSSKYLLLDEKKHNIYQNSSLEYIKQNYLDLYKTLLDAQFVVSNDFDEQAIVEYKKIAEKMDTTMYHVVVNVTLDCNLRCWYCYEKKIHNSKLYANVIEAIKLNVTLQYEKVRFKTLKISFFGGEPFLNFEGIRKILDFARTFCKTKDVVLLADFTTNATLIRKEHLEYLQDLKCFFQITLDGNRQKHNEVKHLNGEDTFMRTIDNIHNITNAIKESYIWVRINYDEKTLEHIDDILALIDDLDKNHAFLILRKIWQTDTNDINPKLLTGAIQKILNHKFFVDCYCNAIVSVPLGMKFGGIGCALGTAISMIVGNGFIMNWYYQTHIGLDMVYFWKRILGIVPAMLPAIALGVAAVRLHTFTGYSGVLTFAVPYAAVYAAGLYRFAMDESERDMVRSVVRKIRR